MIKNIKTIAPLLASEFIDIEDDPINLELNQKMIANNYLRLGSFYEYIGQLHDSWILKVSIDKGKFSIVLNDFTTHVFADALIEKKKLNIAHETLIFPLHLEFEISNLSFNKVDENGDIQEIDPINIDEYLYEQIISINKNNIEVGLIVWKNNEDKPGERILILINAKTIETTEYQESAWVNIFGNTYDKYYKYFKSELGKGRYMSGYTHCLDLLDEYDGQNK